MLPTDARSPSTTKAWPLVKRFWTWVRPHQRYAWWILIVQLLGAPLALVSPLIVRRVVDDVVVRRQTDEIVYWGAVLIALTLIGVVLNFATGYWSTLFQHRVLRDVRAAVYRHVQRLSQGFMHDHETGWLMTRVQEDAANLGGVMADGFARAAVDALRAVSYVVLIFYVEWHMATAGVLLAGAVFGFQYLISARIRTLSKASQTERAELGRALHQSISGHELVQATAAEAHETRRLTRALHGSVRAEVRRDLFSLGTRQVFGILGGVAPTLIVLGGVYLIARSGFTVGGLFAFFMYLTRLFGSVGAITELNPRLQQSLASLERIYEVLDTEIEIRSPADAVTLDAVQGEITFEGVDFEYVADTPVLQQLSFTVPARQVVALVGPSGAGKTTIARLLPRFHDPTGGRVLLDGHDLRSLDLGWFRRHVGIVPQDIFLFDRTVAQNIAYGTGSTTAAAIRQAATDANALEFIEELPDGFDTLIGERGVKLSGGQRQRIAIAREMLRAPSVLVLDEATSSLDSETERLIQAALGRLLMGRTAVIIAHRLSTVRRADNILVLDQGRIVESGRHDELLAADGLYAQLYRIQFDSEAAGGE